MFCLFLNTFLPFKNTAKENMMGELRWATEYAITNSLRKIESKLTLDVRIWYRVLLRNCKIENNNTLIGTSHHSGVEIGSQFLELFVHLKYFTGVLMQRGYHTCHFCSSRMRESDWLMSKCFHCFNRPLRMRVWPSVVKVWEQCHRMNPISFCTSVLF